MIFSVCGKYLAWYDSDLVPYQKDRQETELEKVFEERNTIAQQGGEVIGAEHLKQKVMKEPQPEWTQSVRQKKTEDYYSKLREVRVAAEFSLIISKHIFYFRCKFKKIKNINNFPSLMHFKVDDAIFYINFFLYIYNYIYG